MQRTFGRPIQCRVAGRDASAWSLPEAEAIPIALTLNELLTNAVKHSANGSGDGAIGCVLDCDDDSGAASPSRTAARLPDGFSLARIPNGVSGLGLVRALLPKKSASLSIEQSADDVVATVTLRPPGVQRAGA